MSNDKKAEKDNCRMITSEFRVSHPHVFVPQAPKPTDKKKYSITMLFPKSAGTPTGYAPLRDGQTKPDPRTLKEIMTNAKIAAFGPDKSRWPKDLESPVNDGDDPKYADKEGYKGHWVIKAVSNENQRPTVVSRQRGDDGEYLEITDPNELYPGCYARAHIFAYKWEYMKKQGIGFILDHVQKTREGKSFAGKKSANQVFGSLPDDTDEMMADDEAF